MFAFGGKIFTLRHVEINVSLDENALMKYLGLDASRSIFSYDDRALENKLLKLDFIERASVSKRLPGTIKIDLAERKPVALVNTADGEVCFIDAGGVIFRDGNLNREDLVFVTFGRHEQLKPGMILNERYRKICGVLSGLKIGDPSLYDAVSQIDVAINGDETDYFVRYDTKQQTLCLKNQINVDSIRKGLVSILYLNENEKDTLIYTNNGIAVD